MNEINVSNLTEFLAEIRTDLAALQSAGRGGALLDTESEAAYLDTLASYQALGAALDKVEALSKGAKDAGTISKINLALEVWRDTMKAHQKRLEIEREIAMNKFLDSGPAVLH